MAQIASPAAPAESQAIKNPAEAGFLVERNQASLTPFLTQLLRSNHVHDQFRSHIAVNLELNFVLTSGAQNTVWQTNFALSYFNACCSYCIRNVASAD